VILESTPVAEFDQVLGRAGAMGVKVSSVVEDQMAPRRRFEPSHPDADSDGYVSLPNVDPAEEMVDMLGAARAYQANLAAIGLIRDLVQRALEIGKG
jgi:flagellar basal-body rod protein FlgC